MRIGNWETWKDRGSEERYEFTASNGVVLRLYEQFDDDSGIGLDDRECVRDDDSPTGWRYLDTDEPMDEFDFQSIDVSQSLWRAEAYVNDECVEVTGHREQPEAQAQLLAEFSRAEDPEIAAAGREALADWNTVAPDHEDRPVWFDSLLFVDPYTGQNPTTWEPS